jgi:ribosome biogenesis protein Tsr3
LTRAVTLFALLMIGFAVVVDDVVARAGFTVVRRDDDVTLTRRGLTVVDCGVAQLVRDTRLRITRSA